MEENSRAGRVGFVLKKVAMGQVYLSVLLFSCQYDSTNAPNSYFIYLPSTIQYQHLTASLILIKVTVE
jgi:hypothetical protein